MGKRAELKYDGTPYTFSKAERTDMLRIGRKLTDFGPGGIPRSRFEQLQRKGMCVYFSGRVLFTDRGSRVHAQMLREHEADLLKKRKERERRRLRG